MPYPFQITSLEQYYTDYKKSIDNPDAFWGDVADQFVWKKKWNTVSDWNFKEPLIKWFSGGQLNITENCLDRHLEKNANTTALIFEPNNPNDAVRKITYQELYDKVCQAAHVLKNNGVKKGDRVCIYMGMIPELAIAMLACARIGAIHSIIFGGFSAQSIADRIQDCQATFMITCDGACRGAKDLNLKNIVDEALTKTSTIKNVLVYQHNKMPVTMKEQRDIWWHDEIQKVITSGKKGYPAESMDSEDPLFILYTSGSTGKPKGVVHSVAGYMIYATYSFVNVFQYKPQQIHFCTADIGWVTGHSYITYGPLCAGATSLIFEGVPTFPDAGRFWDIVDKHQVNILYTAPTAIRSLMGFGLEPFKNKKLDSLKVIGSVGEPINEEAWHWYDEHVGKKRCPIVDTWWQTETGGIMISNLAGITPAKPAHATLPLPGVLPILVDEKGVEIKGNSVSGNLCLKNAWPSTIRTTYNDHERCRTAYFATYDNLYFTGDGALRDDVGNYRITGRVDDVMNISGHRIGTAEVENAINIHDAITESAVVGYPHDIKGQGIYAYVIYKGDPTKTDTIKAEIIQHTIKEIGPFAKPDKIQFVSGLPRTRSGKIMRRILRKIAEGETQNLGDLSTIVNPEVIEEIKNGKL